MATRHVCARRSRRQLHDATVQLLGRSKNRGTARSEARLRPGGLPNIPRPATAPMRPEYEPLAYANEYSAREKQGFPPPLRQRKSSRHSREIRRRLFQVQGKAPQTPTHAEDERSERKSGVDFAPAGPI